MKKQKSTFASLAAESRKHPAYWKALAELEYGEMKADRDRLRRWLRWMGKKHGSRDTVPGYFISEDCEDALRGDPAPRRRKP